jgi:hypothetical protein
MTNHQPPSPEPRPDGTAGPHGSGAPEQGRHETGADETGSAKTGADGTGTDGTGPVKTGPDGSRPDEPLGEEEMLRRLLHESVRDIEPSTGSLDTLQRAVPARRRQRHRLVAAATTVAVLAVGTPVTLQAASLGTDDRTVETGHNHEADGSTGMDGHGDGPGTQATTGGEREQPADGGQGERTDEPVPDDSEDPEVLDPDEEDPLASSFPRCAREQLGDVSTRVDPADKEGLIYGTVRLTNVSDDTCRVRGVDEMTVTALDATEVQPDSPQVVSRTEGDRATALPLPDLWLEELVLLPGEAYEVRFAWVPRRGVDDGGCSVPADPEKPPGDGGTTTSGSTTGGSTDSGTTTTGEVGTEAETSETPDDAADAGGTDGGTGDTDGSTGGTETGGTDDTGGSGTSGGTTGDGGSEGPGDPDEPEPEGVVIRYTPAAGSPRAARLELIGSCAGTLHRTGVLEVPAGTP